MNVAFFRDIAQQPATLWFLAWLIFYPDDVGDMFLQYDSSRTTTQHYIPEDGNIQLLQSF
jgi:hypothetical protein